MTPEDARRWNMAKWLVAQGDEGPGASRLDGTCIVAAHASMAEEVNVVEWWLTRDGPYWDRKGSRKRGNKKKVQKMALSRILVAQIVWKYPMGGKAATVVATTHLNRLTAKGQQSGMKAARTRYFELLVKMLKEHKPDVLTGDFNMALLLVVPCLREAGIAAELISWYAFRATGADAAPEVEEDDDDDARDGAAAAVAATPQTVVKLESVAIICLKPLFKIKSEMSLEKWDNPEQLPAFDKEGGPGYPLRSYVGGDRALRESLRRLPPLVLPQPKPNDPEAAAVAAEVKCQTAKG